MKWKKIGNNTNEILEDENFYISYNRNTQTPIFCEIFNAFSGEEVTDGEETALNANNKWYILTGDFRKEYEAAFPQGLDACMKVYNRFKDEFRNNWSTD